MNPAAMPVQMISQFRDMHDMEMELIGLLQASKDTGKLALYSDKQLEEMVEGTGGGGTGEEKAE
jgi:hypothetical protein